MPSDSIALPSPRTRTALARDWKTIYASIDQTTRLKHVQMSEASDAKNTGLTEKAPIALSNTTSTDTTTGYARATPAFGASTSATRATSISGTLSRYAVTLHSMVTDGGNSIRM